MLINQIHSHLKSFAADTKGSISVEFALAMPILFWAFMATYVFFDGYRQSAVNLKAAYTIGDLVSRETAIINDEYVDSMHSLMGELTHANSPISLRITVIRWDEGDDRYYVDWSVNRGYEFAMNNDTIGDIETRLPVMPDNERVILVETINVYEPYFDIGMEDRSMDNFVFTRPRFAPQVLYSAS